MAGAWSFEKILDGSLFVYVKQVCRKSGVSFLFIFCVVQKSFQTWETDRHHIWYLIYLRYNVVHGILELKLWNEFSYSFEGTWKVCVAKEEYQRRHCCWVGRGIGTVFHIYKLIFKKNLTQWCVYISFSVSTHA